MTQPDTLHTRLRAELDRRLMAAHGADDGKGTWYQAEDLDRGMTYATRRFIELFSPLAVIAWLEGELQVLERHAPKVQQASGRVLCVACDEKIDFNMYGEVAWPCPDVRSLAHRLGVSIDG